MCDQQFFCPNVTFLYPSQPLKKEISNIPTLAYVNCTSVQNFLLFLLIFLVFLAKGPNVKPFFAKVCKNLHVKSVS